MPKTLENYRAGKKDPKQPKDKSARLEGAATFVPDCGYTSGDTYSFAGLGSVFDGDYKFKKVTHTVSKSGYAVQADVYRRLGGSTGVDPSNGADQAPPPEPRRDPAPTTPVLQDAPLDEPFVYIDKNTGNVSLVPAMRPIDWYPSIPKTKQFNPWEYDPPFNAL